MIRPSLILLIGPPGCGKTTYGKDYVSDRSTYIYLSSDEIRKELYGDETIQGDPHEVFSLMQSRAVEALNNGNSVVYDATNMTRKDRAGIIAACPKFVNIEAHVVWAPIETCIERDAMRERTVGKAIVDKMLKRFQPPFYDEGIHDIQVIVPEMFNQIAYGEKIRDNMNIPHDNHHHTLNIKEHCEAAARYAWNNNYGSNVFAAALYHDVGKPYVKAFVDSKGNPSEDAHYYQHQCISAWMYYGVYDKDPEIAWLIGVHMDPFLNAKYYNKLPAYLKQKVDQLHECDLAAH